MKKFTAAAIVALFLVVGMSSVKAQSPDGQFGVGVAMGDVSGAQIQYAISPAFHIGTRFGISIMDGNTGIGLGPYLKFIFAGSKEFKPYVQAMLSFQNTSVDLGPNTASSTQTGVNLGFGGEYFITPNFGAFGGITLVNIPFEKNEDPLVASRKVSFGVLMPTIGIEWFM